LRHPALDQVEDVESFDAGELLEPVFRTWFVTRLHLLLKPLRSWW
jgi:hypothetical protein